MNPSIKSVLVAALTYIVAAPIIVSAASFGTQNFFYAPSNVITPLPGFTTSWSGGAGASTAGFFTATSSTATSTFAGALTVGTSRLVVTTAGKVGIGTSTPLSLLDIYGDYPTFKVRNFDSAQFSGAGFYLLNNAMTGTQGGHSFYSGINDAGGTQSFLAIDQTNTGGGSTGHLLLFTGTTSTEVYTPFLVNGTNVQLSQDTSGYFNFQEVAGAGNGQQSIMQIFAPTSQPQESTLTLNRATSTSYTNSEFTDITDENYGAATALNGGVDHAFSINISKKGIGTFRPYDVRFWNQDGGSVASTSYNAFTILPNTNGTSATTTSVTVGIATSTPWGELSVAAPTVYSSNPLLEVASSTTDLFRIMPTGQLLMSVSPVTAPAGNTVLTISPTATNFRTLALLNPTQATNNNFAGLSFGDAFTTNNSVFFNYNNQGTGNANNYLNMAFFGAPATGGVTITALSRVGVGTTSPAADFQVSTTTANATTSAEFGKSGQNKGDCQTHFDTAGTPVYCWFNAGATSQTCQNGGTTPPGCALNN